MWTRTDLKRNAKSVLKKNYWKSVIVSLIFLFITGSGAASTGREASDELSNAKDAFAGWFYFFTDYRSGSRSNSDFHADWSSSDDLFVEPTSCRLPEIFCQCS